MVFSFVKSMFVRKSTTKPLPALVEPLINKLEEPAIPFIDCDENGLYLIATHVTSSGHADAIRREGLRPIQDLRRSITGYLQELAPNHASEIERILEFREESDRKDGLALLISPRLIAEPNPRCIYANLLLGGREYLKSASTNAFEDGGEVFTVARKIVMQRLGLNLQPRFLNAYPIVVLVKLRLIASESGFKIPNAPDYGPIACDPLDISSFGDVNEIRIVGDVPPHLIELIKCEDFLRREIVPISAAGYAMLQRLCSNDGSRPRNSA